MKNWIKQLGLPKNTINPSDKCDYYRTIDFPEKPTGVQIGDHLFVYAVGHKYLYAHLEVLSVPFEAHPQEIVNGLRHPNFPWMLFCRNVNPTFSDEWHERKLDLFMIAEEYHQQTGLLVSSGKGNVNAILAGHSYFKIQDDFAQYLLQKMD